MTTHCDVILVPIITHRDLILVAMPTHWYMILVAMTTHWDLILVAIVTHRDTLLVAMTTHGDVTLVIMATHRDLILVVMVTHRDLRLFLNLLVNPGLVVEVIDPVSELRDMVSGVMLEVEELLDNLKMSSRLRLLSSLGPWPPSVVMVTTMTSPRYDDVTTHVTMTSHTPSGSGTENKDIDVKKMFQNRIIPYSARIDFRRQNQMSDSDV